MLIAGLTLMAIGMNFTFAAPGEKDKAKERAASKAACLACAETCKKCLAAHEGNASCCSLCEVCRNMCLACAAADGKEVQDLLRATCEKVCRKCSEHCKSVDDETSRECFKACIACADACKAALK